MTYESVERKICASRKGEGNVNIGRIYGGSRWAQIGEMEVKSDLIESSCASLCCVDAASNPET